MNRTTRDKLTAGTNQADLTAGSACTETPPAVFQDLNNRFGPFVIDLCANTENHCCPIWFGPGSPLLAEDALTANWRAHARVKKVFSNPPYGKFAAKMLEKAVSEAKRGQPSVHLLPMRATKAFHRYVLSGASKLLFCDKRITFFEGGRPRLTLCAKTGRMAPTAALFDSIIVVYYPIGRRRKHAAPTCGTYRVPEHVKGW